MVVAGFGLQHWFTLRENVLGLVPVAKSYVQAEPVLNKYHELELGDNEDAKSDLWDLIKDFPYKSRSLSALVSSRVFLLSLVICNNLRMLTSSAYEMETKK